MKVKKLNKHSFIKLLAGQTIANIGDTLYTIAMISSVFAMTHSVFAAAIVPVIITGSMVLSGLLTPLIIVRVSLTQLLKSLQLCKTVFLFGLAIYLQLSSSVQLLVLFGFISCIAFLDGCADPVATALLPHYVAKENLMRANSIFSTLLQIVSIGSWAGGSSLLILFSVSNLVWLDMGIFLIATSLFWWLPQVENKIESKESEWKNFSVGWQEIRQQPLLRTVVSMDILEGVANTAWVSAVILSFVKDVLHVTENWWGYINATFFAGALLGSLVVMRLTGRTTKKATLIWLGSLGGALVTFLVAPGWHPVFVLFCSVLVGVFSQIKNIPQSTVLQQHIPNEKLVAVYAAMNVLYTGTFAVASLIAGSISDLFGAQTIFLLSGILLLLVAVMARKKYQLFDE